MIRLNSHRLYTGITTDVDRRFSEHVQGGQKAARTTRGCRDLCLVYHCPVGSRGLALSIEYRIKKSPKSVKEDIVHRQCDLDALSALLAHPETQG